MSPSSMVLTFAHFLSFPSLALARLPALLPLPRFMFTAIAPAFDVSFVAAHIALVTADIPFVSADIALVPPGAVMPLRLSLMRAGIPAPLMLRVMALHIAPPLDMPPAPFAMGARLSALLRVTPRAILRMTAASMAALRRVAASFIVVIRIG